MYVANDVILTNNKKKQGKIAYKSDVIRNWDINQNYVNRINWILNRVNWILLETKQ